MEREPTLDEVKKDLFLARLEHYGGDKEKVAASLGVSLRTVYNCLRRWGVALPRRARQRRCLRSNGAGGAT